LRGPPHNPGSGGWPTIRYFTKETGIEGGTYTKVTDEPMCKELGDRNLMVDYVEGYANTALCDVQTKEHCTEKEAAYVDTWSQKTGDEQLAQLQRLQGMVSGQAMNKDLEEWAWRRQMILQKLQRGQTPVEQDL